MNKLIFLSLFVLSLIVGSLTISLSSVEAFTTQEFPAQITQFLTQSKVLRGTILQAQLAQAQAGGAAAWCHTFGASLHYGMSGVEIKALQTVLQKEGFLQQEETNKEGLIYFGEKTASAAVEFKQKHKVKDVSLFNLKYSTGYYVGAKTREKLNSLYGCGNVVPGATLQQSNLSLTSLSPSSGPVGTTVTLHGSGFTSTGNTIVFSSNTAGMSTGFSDRTSSDGKALTFVIPRLIAVGTSPTQPDFIVDLGDYQISVTNKNGRTSIQTFTITTTVTPQATTQPSITVLSPNGGDKWEMGKTYDIVWTPTEVVDHPTFRMIDPLTIILKDDHLQSSKITESVLAYKGRYSWKVPSTFDNPRMKPGDKFKIILKGTYLHDESDNYFSIMEPIPPVAYDESKPNIVLFLTDDQRWDTLWAMPILQEKLLKKGINYTNAFVTTPLCCPSRASLISGGFYPHDVGILTNELPNGGIIKGFNDSDTIGTALQNVGYKTALVGKYMNYYLMDKNNASDVMGDKDLAPYIPPGWNKWVGTDNTTNWTNYGIVIGSSGKESSTGAIVRETKYVTDYLKDHALSFLNETKNDPSPFFLFLSFLAPHGPATPAPQDAALFSDFTPSGRAFGEEDLSDKPQWVQEQAEIAWKDDSRAKSMEFIRNQLRSLQAVDRAIGAVIDNIEQQGRLNNTVFIFTSDHGYLWGEHRLFHKQKQYEESIRVPLVIVLPRMLIGIFADQPQEESRMVAMNLDIPATIFEILDLQKQSDGKSLLYLIGMKTAPKWRDHILIENFSESLQWSGIRTPQWKYIESSSGEKELYDLIADPYELESKNDPGVQTNILLELSKLLEKTRGLQLTTGTEPAKRAVTLPNAIVGQPYTFQLTAWGGKEPYKWIIANGVLPTGLSLNEAKGLISGTSLQIENKIFSITVKDSSVTRHGHTAQSYTKKFKINVAR